MLGSFVCLPVLCHAVARVLCVVARMFAYWTSQKSSPTSIFLIFWSLDISSILWLLEDFLRWVTCGRLILGIGSRKTPQVIVTVMLALFLDSIILKCKCLNLCSCFYMCTCKLQMTLSPLKCYRADRSLLKCEAGGRSGGFHESVVLAAICQLVKWD